MKSGRAVTKHIIFMILGITLYGLGCTEAVDEYWSGLGSGLLVVSVLRLIQLYRFRKDDAYREKIETEMTDERNRFLRNKAWAWAGYLFILIAGSSVLVLKVIGQDLFSLAASYAVCLMLLLYWGSYMVLRKKY